MFSRLAVPLALQYNTRDKFRAISGLRERERELYSFPSLISFMSLWFLWTLRTVFTLERDHFKYHSMLKPMVIKDTAEKNTQKCKLLQPHSGCIPYWITFIVDLHFFFYFIMYIRILTHTFLFFVQLQRGLTQHMKWQFMDASQYINKLCTPVKTTRLTINYRTHTGVRNKLLHSHRCEEINYSTHTGVSNKL